MPLTLSALSLLHSRFPILNLLMTYCHFVPLLSFFKLGKELPSNVQIYSLLCIAPDRDWNAYECGPNRMRYCLYGTPSTCYTYWWILYYLCVVCKLYYLLPDSWLAYLYDLHQHPFAREVVSFFLVNFTEIRSVKIRWTSFAISFQIDTSMSIGIWWCASRPSCLYCLLALSAIVVLTFRLKLVSH